MWKCCMLFLIPLLLSSCAADLWKEVPDFEVFNFTCPVPGSKFLDNSNFVSGWSVLGPLDPGKEPSLHTELLQDEGILNGNRNAPRKSRWYRVIASSNEEETVFGLVDFGSKFAGHPRSGKRSAFYACATLKCDRGHKGLVMNLVRYGQMKVWINGKIVYAGESLPGGKAETVQVHDLELLKGCNRMVVKYMDDAVQGPFRRIFSLRFTDAAGNFSAVR